MHLHSHRMVLVWVAVWTALLIATCTPAPVQQGQRATGLFRQRWWNYFERGLDAADARDYGAAGSDLTEALRQRDRDQRMARTYGMHFIDYFPHRELGVVHWLEGDLAAAERELKLSIAQEPSAKARYYLDQVRKAVIKRRGATVQPPRVELDVAAGSLWSANPRVTLSGRARDANYISAVRVDGASLPLEGARTEFSFSQVLDLPQGCREVVIEADNLAGRTVRRTATVCVDSLGPTLVLERIEPRRSGVWIAGTVLDGAGVAALTINGQPITTDGTTEFGFSHLLDNPPPQSLIQCRDRLGNRSAYLLDRASLKASRTGPLLVAGLELAGLLGGRDDQPPVLRLQQWQAQQTVYLDKVVLSGSVRDAGLVASLTVNGEPVLPRRAPMVFYTHILDLQPGPNPVTIEARDAAGNSRALTFLIERKIPRQLLLEERLRLTVFAFDQKGRISPASFAFQDDFIHTLVRRGRFQVVERQRLDLILQEQKINRSDLIDAATALRLGNLAAAQAVVAGALVETRTGIEIVARVIDTETAQVLCTADVYGEDKSLPGLNTLAQALSLKLHREFPLVEGLVIDKQADTIITDLTLEKLRAQRRILVYTEHPVVHPDTGRSMGSDYQVLGAARIIQADDHLAKASLQPGANPAIAPRQRVITQ
jgi:TolB-like protein